MPSPGANDKLVIAAFGGYWSSVAASGDPNGAGRVAWPTVTTGDDSLVIIDAAVTTDSTYRNAQCDFWAGSGM
jgi:carboxylesterase type B